MDLIKVIQEAATWIEKFNKDYDVNLYRSSEFLPDQHFIHMSENERFQMINAIIKKRSGLIKESGIELIPVDELHKYGRVVLFNPDNTLFDWRLQSYSHYYLDYSDMPPIDTLITYKESPDETEVFNHQSPIYQALLAWVPSNHYENIDEAAFAAHFKEVLWINAEDIREPYSYLRPFFTEPERIQLSELPIDEPKRQRLMEEFEKKLEKNKAAHVKTEVREKNHISFIGVLIPISIILFGYLLWEYQANIATLGFFRMVIILLAITGVLWWRAIKMK